jgi:hypothetical protein
LLPHCQDNADEPYHGSQRFGDLIRPVGKPLTPGDASTAASAAASFNAAALLPGVLLALACTCLGARYGLDLGGLWRSDVHATGA